MRRASRRMSFMVPLMLFGWPLLTVLLFSAFKPRAAVLISFIGAWLFLPMAEYSIPGLPDYTKVSAATLGILAGTLFFEPSRLFRFRPHWIDVPVIVYCLWSATSSFATGIGLWDAISAIVSEAIGWGLPYFIGRIYFTDLNAFRELAVGIVVGGLIYVPLCLIEIRLSPQLHTWVYGFHQHMFAQSIRFGGFRPTVFMQHGLAVAMWMINATLLAMWLRATGAVRRLGGLPLELFVLVMLITCVLCKSTGALALMLLGFAALVVARLHNRSWPLYVLTAIAPLWMIGRTFDWFNGQFVSDLFVGVSSERAASFSIRLNQENEILKTALQHPIFGGSRWFPDGADQLWLLCFRNFGAVGLAALTSVFLLPGLVLCHRLTFTKLSHPDWAPVTGMILIVVLYMIDNLANSMMNPVFTMTAGALGTAIAAQIGQRPECESATTDRRVRTPRLRRKLWPPPIPLGDRLNAKKC
ncbi:MAG TPA: hypothetical protein PLR25_11715 [Planctomycetaceae bacterium]|nr:hypothetical protein [Planctomycetaceae bacterium]